MNLPSICTILTGAVVMAGFSAPVMATNQDKPPAAVLRDAAFQIDRHVAVFYRNQKLEVPSVADDAKFLRRTYLTIIGRVPTHDEAIAFLESDATGKRQVLVANLLDSPGYGSHMTNWIFDLIRLQDRNDRTSLEPYRHWVSLAMNENMPWDEFTRNLLASRGSGWEQENAAVGYYVRDRGMPHDNLANSMRIFLGKRMECAQCHHDPFGDTKRRDFFELAAFTGGQRPMKQENIAPLIRELNDGGDAKMEEYRIALMIRDNVHALSLGSGGSGRATLPSDYQYRDAKPGDVLGANTPFGRPVRMSPRRDHDDGREKLADWVTAHTGQQFAAVIANRMWKRVMGSGLVEPVDDFTPMEESHHPALFNHLAKIMVDLNYDLKAFQHVLLLTRTYQFETNPNPSTVHSGDDFHGRRLQRLSAEQIWDSLVTLATGNPDSDAHSPLDETIYIDGRPVLMGRKTMSQLSGEILTLRSERDFRRYFDDLVKEIRDSRSGGGGDVEASMSMQAAGRAPARRGLIRAAELPSPAPRGHFLGVFGQSDREVVDASSREPNVSQVLALMNGFVQQEIISKPEATLYQGLGGLDEPAAKVRHLYLTILSRPPTVEEMEWTIDEVNAHGDAGIRNLAAALVMSSEFLFLQ